MSSPVVKIGVGNIPSVVTTCSLGYNDTIRNLYVNGYLNVNSLNSILDTIYTLKGGFILSGYTNDSRNSKIGLYTTDGNLWLGSDNGNIYSNAVTNFDELKLTSQLKIYPLSAPILSVTCIVHAPFNGHPIKLVKGCEGI